MKKRIGAVLLAVLMLASMVIVPLPAVATDGYVTVRLHYHRPDGNYEGIDVWLWDWDDITKLTPPYSLTVDPVNNEAVCEFSVKSGTSIIGYIIRKNGWEIREVGYDQHINITGVLSGTVDFYVESGVPTQDSAVNIPTRQEQEASGNLVLGDDVDIGLCVLSVTYKVSYGRKPNLDVLFSNNQVENMTGADFRITDKSGNVIPVKIHGYAGKHVLLTLEQKLDPLKNYTLTFGDDQFEITVPNQFDIGEFLESYTYHGDDLGATYTKTRTKLRLWAPLSEKVSVNLYKNGDPNVEEKPYEVVPLTKDIQGTWTVDLEGDLNGVYYSYTVVNEGKTVEACDPYARTTGINGKRAMILDLESTNPSGWGNDMNPNAGCNITDAIIYAVDLRDFSTDSSSGISNAGKYLGIVERGTHTAEGISTGLDYIVDLGVTHVQLTPLHDFSVGEGSGVGLNCGYDPVNYNVPEDTYSSDPYNGAVRVREMKQMVKGFHDAGLSVVMDMVYSHVYNIDLFSFNQIVPGYFSREKHNESGCGNDNATERTMVRKYIIDSVSYWATEYHIDGFRLDFAGLIDVDTVNQVMSAVKSVRPDVIFYGEGMSLSTLSEITMCTQDNSEMVPGFAFHSDTFCNYVVGASYGGPYPKGFIFGDNSKKAILADCFIGMPSWCNTPSQSVNQLFYQEGRSIYDYLTLVGADIPEQTRTAINRLGAAFLLTAQGIPFICAGDEMLHSKPNKRESILEGDKYVVYNPVNALQWNNLSNEAYQQTYQYYKGLIAFRKAHPALRLSDADAVRQAVSTYGTANEAVTGYLIKTAEETILVVFNPNSQDTEISLPEGNWNRYVDDCNAGLEVLDSFTGSFTVAGISASVLVQEEPAEEEPSPQPPEENPEENNPSENNTSVEEGKNEDKKEKQEKKKRNDDDEDMTSGFELFLEDYLIWIILGGVVLLAGGAFAVLMLLRYRRNRE